MELALLVYVVDLLSKLGGFLSAAMFGTFMVTAFLAVISVMCLGSGTEEDINGMKSLWKRYYPVKTILAALFLMWVIPSTQTMKYIAAGYLIQETFESEFVQETVSLSQKAVIKQLQTWAEDNADIEQLLESVDIPVPEQLQKKGES